MSEALYLLALDTCGTTGTVALGRYEEGVLSILGEREMAGRSFSATLVRSVADLLAEAQLAIEQLRAIVVVHGPGSFTGVRVGLSAVMGFAEGAGAGVVPVSRLAVLASLCPEADAVMLDAHRNEVFLRLCAAGAEPRELLAGSEELAGVHPAPALVLYCDAGAEALLGASWPGSKRELVAAPTASDALRLALAKILRGEFTPAVELDGHYLRRSDAEIFGAPGVSRP